MQAAAFVTPRPVRPQWTSARRSTFRFLRPRPAIPAAGFVRAGVGGIGVTGGLAANALCKDCDLVIGVGTRFNDFVTGSKWVLFRNPDIKVLAINTSEFHAEKLDATRCIGDAKVTLEAIMEKLKADGYKSGYTTEIQDIRKVWEEERLRVLGVQYKGEGFGEGKFVPCVPSWTEKIMNDFVDKSAAPSPSPTQSASSARRQTTTQSWLQQQARCRQTSSVCG